MEVIQPEDLITYESLVQEDTCEYYDIVNSKQWGSDVNKEKSHYHTSPTKTYTASTKKSVIK